MNIEPPEKTPQEQLELKVEMERLIKSLPERKRRTFLRYMKKGKEIDGEANAEPADDKNEGSIEIEKLRLPRFNHSLCHIISDSTENGVESAKKKVFVPHNRQDLLNKFESLKVADDDEDFSFDDSDPDSDFDGGEFGDDDDDEDAAADDDK